MINLIVFIAIMFLLYEIIRIAVIYAGMIFCVLVLIVGIEVLLRILEGIK